MKPNIDPKVDCVFKALLGSEEHKRLLTDFLNAVLAQDPGIRLQSVELMNPYNEREFETDKLSVVDVKARDEAGRVYQIEIQLVIHPGLAERMLHTWCAIYHRQIQKGQDFSALKPVISIWLLNEPLFNLPGAWHLPFVPYNLEYGLVLSRDFRIHLLQLTLWPHREQRPDALDRWMYLFLQGEEVDADAPPAILQTDEMKEAIDVLRHFSENEHQYWLYQQRLEAEHLSATWQRAVERAEEKIKQAQQEIKQVQQEKKRAEQEAKLKAEEAERERQEKELVKQQAECERQEKERLLALLKQAGIDPTTV